MSEKQVGTVDDLLAREAVMECLYRYARGVDRADSDLVRSVFWPDARIRQSALHGSPEDLIAAWESRREEREVSFHLILNPTVSLHVAGRASLETYAYCASKARLADALELIGGRYLDEFEARSGEWRILERRALVDWRCVTDASDMVARLKAGPHGLRNSRDPSYETLSGLGS